jgi:hypothetical protein
MPKTPPQRDAQRDADYRRLYNLTLSDYNRMVQAQNGRCAMCREEPRPNHAGKVHRLCVDHRHGSDPIQVRGLLCHPCNRFIRACDDSVDRLIARRDAVVRQTARGIAYLTGFPGVPR